MDEKNRQRLGFFSSLLIHFLIFVGLGLSGIFAYQKETGVDFAEVDLVSPTQVAEADLKEAKGLGTGGGGGGGGGSLDGHGTGDPNAAAIQEPGAVKDGSAAVPDPDPIKTENGMETPDASGPPAALHSGTAEGADRGFGTGSGTGGGNGSGNGTGDGSGVGPGSGSGSGGGHGSGHGTGIGSGEGSGYGGEVVSNPAVPPKVVNAVAPYYPPALKDAGIEGLVGIRCIIGTDGEVESAELVRSCGNSTLDASALEAVQQWSFSAARNGEGQKVRCYMNIPVRFRIDYR